MPKQQREDRKTTKFVNFQKRDEVRVSLLQLGNNPDHGCKVKLASRISYLSAKRQVLRKSRHSGLSHLFLLFSMSFTTK